jgi:transketolase
LRPADAKETAVCWKIALENKETPTALLLSRQGIPDLPSTVSSRFEDALGASKGAYIVQDSHDTPDVILVGNGSEVSTLIDGAEKLTSRESLNVRVVSAPSEGLFRLQPQEYQDEVLPGNIPTFGMTAGLPVTLRGLAGPKGKVFGLDHFGYSAPFKVLDEKFGFTGDNVYQQVMTYLKEFK